MTKRVSLNKQSARPLTCPSRGTRPPKPVLLTAVLGLEIKSKPILNKYFFKIKLKSRICTKLIAPGGGSPGGVKLCTWTDPPSCGARPLACSKATSCRPSNYLALITVKYRSVKFWDLSLKKI